MLRLTATDQSITMTTSASGSVDYISDWTDIVNTTAVTTAGSGQGNVTTAATTTIIAAPASGSSRAVKSAMISNRHGSTSNTIQLFKTVGAASYAISKPFVLLAGETVRFSDEGFCFVGNACDLEVTSATTAEQLESNATTGVMQVVGPAAGTTRIATIPDANFTMARTDAAQTFSGVQTFGGRVLVDDTTNATTTTDGSIQTDGGISAVKSIISGLLIKAINGSTGGGEVRVDNSSNNIYASFRANDATGAGITYWPNSILFEAVPTGTGNLVIGAYSGSIVFQTGARGKASTIDSAGDASFGGNMNVASGKVYKVNGTQVVGAQGASIADATDAASAITQLNLVIARLRAHGLIST